MYSTLVLVKTEGTQDAGVFCVKGLSGGGDKAIVGSIWGQEPLTLEFQMASACPPLGLCSLLHF